ncbi:MAG: SRPBCC family protein [Micrococcales bacterium]|nr:SRPBCC family protein [Micrococcales bacterium]
MKISYGAVVPLPPDEAFAFVSDPEKWPTFFESMRSVEKGDDWGAVGGHARMTNVLLGRSIESELELTAWDPPREYRYTARQPGPGAALPKGVRAGTRGTQLSGTTEAALRRGLSGLIDRVWARALQGMFAKAMRRLPEAVRKTSGATGA